jgi:hypothetical protein
MFVFDYENCTFDTLANDYKCYNFVDPILADLGGYFSGANTNCPNLFYDPTNGPVPTRCHIIDLSPYIDYYINQPGSGFLCNDGCNRAHWLNSFYGGNTSQGNNTFIGKSFNSLINNCNTYAPANKY